MGALALFLLVFTEVHPCAERSLALAIAFIQIQIAIWVVLTGFPTLVFRMFYKSNSIARSVLRISLLNSF